MTRFAVFASGRGSNLDALVEAIERGELKHDLVVVVSDQPNAPVLGKAEQKKIPTLVVPALGRSSEVSIQERRRIHETQILEELKPFDVHFLVLAGYMRILSPTLLNAFDSHKGYKRIVNIHPSFLPEFPGLDAYRQAFEAGRRETGVTVHLVDGGVDTGPICAQEKFSIAGLKSVEEVQTRGLSIEHRLYSRTLEWVLSEAFNLEAGSRYVSPS